MASIKKDFDVPGMSDLSSAARNLSIDERASSAVRTARDQWWKIIRATITAASAAMPTIHRGRSSPKYPSRLMAGTDP